MYKTKSINHGMVPRGWVEMDASNQVVGRFASQIAILLRGKDKPFYTPHVDCGVYVVVVNAEKAVFTGRKEKNKRYLSYTGYPSGQRMTSPEKLRQKHPTRILEKAVKGMLRKNKLRKQLLSKLHIYAGSTHPHMAQTKQRKQQ